MLELKKSIHLDSLRQPFKRAIVTAKQLGADAVEINGTTEIRASNLTRTAVRQIRKMLSDLQLKVSAIYFPTRLGYGDVQALDHRIDATKATLNMAYELGCNVVVNRVGRIPESDQDPQWTTLIQALMDIGNYSQKAGAWLAARTGAEDGAAMRRLLDSLPAHSLTIDFDPAELIINRHSPTDAMKVLSEQVMSFRARDAVTDLSLGRGVEVQMGRGSVDWPALLGALEEQHYRGYLTVERHEADNAILECGQAMEFLTHLFS